MPIPSEVPTSFVPHAQMQSSSTHPTHIDLLGAFLFSSLGIFIIAILISGGIFIYQKSLDGQLAGRQAQLHKIEKTINQSTVYNFVHLRDQLSSTNTLLNGHLTVSRVFDLLESLTVKKVSLTALTLNVPSNGKPATLHVNGIAADFQALTAQAIELKSNNNFSDTVFSGLSLKKNGTVEFQFKTTLSNTLVQNFSAIITANTVPKTTIQTATTTSATATTTGTKNNVTTSKP